MGRTIAGHHLTDGLVAGDEVVVSVELVIADPGLVVVGADVVVVDPDADAVVVDPDAEIVVVGSDDVVIAPDVVLIR
jgi:hypothetical protein